MFVKIRVLSFINQYDASKFMEIRFQVPQSTKLLRLLFVTSDFLSTAFSYPLKGRKFCFCTNQH